MGVKFAAGSSHLRWVSHWQGVTEPELSVIQVGCTVVAAARGAHHDYTGTLPPAVVGPALGGWCNVLGPPAREAALELTSAFMIIMMVVVTVTVSMTR